MPLECMIPCILHSLMATRRLPHDFIRKELQGLFDADHVRLQGDFAYHQAGCSIFFSPSPHGEEFKALFDALPVLSRRLRSPPIARR